MRKIRGKAKRKTGGALYPCTQLFKSDGLIKLRLNAPFGKGIWTTLAQIILPTMKIKLRIALGLMLCIGSLHAQKGLEIGPAFQVQSTWMINDYDFDLGGELDFQNTVQMAYGGYLSYGFAPRHAFRTGVMLSQQGQKYITSDDFVELPGTSYQTLTEYMQIPFLYRYNGDLGRGNSAFLLQVGPQFGMLQKAEGTDLLRNLADSTASISAVQDMKGRYNSMDISALVGIGLTARFSKNWHMNAMLNMSYSLSGIEQNPDRIVGRGITRNAVVGLNVGVFYLFKGPETVKKTPVAPAAQ